MGCYCLLHFVIIKYYFQSERDYPQEYSNTYLNNLFSSSLNFQLQFQFIFDFLLIYCLAKYPHDYFKRVIYNFNYNHFQYLNILSLHFKILQLHFDRSLLFCFSNMNIINCYIHFIQHVNLVIFYLNFQIHHIYFKMKINNLMCRVNKYFLRNLIFHISNFAHFLYQISFVQITLCFNMMMTFLHFISL